MLDVSFGAQFVPAQSKDCRLDSGTCRAEFLFSQALAPGMTQPPDPASLVMDVLFLDRAPIDSDYR